MKESVVAVDFFSFLFLKFQKSSQTHNTIPDAKLQNSLLLQIFFLQLREQKPKKKEDIFFDTGAN